MRYLLFAIIFGMAKPDDNKNYEDLADKVALRASMAGVPARNWTPQMRALDTELKADPKMNAAVTRGVRQNAQQFVADWDGAGQNPELSAFMQSWKRNDRQGTLQAWSRMSPESQDKILADIGQYARDRAPNGDAMRPYASPGLNDILSDPNSSVMDKLSALAKAAVQMITDAFSGFMKPEARQDRGGVAAPVPSSAETPSKDDGASTVPAPSPGLSPEQTRYIEETNSILSAIVGDIEGDLLDLDGDANESALAGQRLAALAPRLSVGFNSSSGLNQMIEIAQAKRELKQNEDNRIDFEEEREKRKKEDAEKSREDWDDYAESAQRVRADRAATMSQSSLDAMEWEGNSYETWNFGSLSGSRKDAYKWAKATRAKLDKLSEENGWTDAERAHEERLLSDFMKATKTGDREAAQQAWQDMKPQTQQAIKREQTRDQNRTLDSENLNENVVLRTGSRQSGTIVSVDAGADMVAAAAQSLSASATQTPAVKMSALSNSPNLNLTDDFTVAAADNPATPAPEPALQLASVAAAPKAAAPVLNQEFSFS